jgi:ligand-binding SRPBCC domain-containing protein
MASRLHFEASTPLEAPPEAVYHFHGDPSNLLQIAPPTLKVIRLEAEPVATEGAEFHLVVRQFGLLVDWTGRWETVRPHSLLVDVGVRCPFHAWRHEHHFTPHGSGTLLTDRVAFQPPGGVLTMPFWKLFLTGMFRSRHQRTQRLFRKAC